MRFSIIIPTLNESKNITSCIKSIIENIKLEVSKKDIEIIIVDGGSQDNTLVKAVRFDNKIKMRIIRSGIASIPCQLNEGAAIAEGDILVFLHADCRLPVNALEKIKNTFNRLPDLAGGAFTMKVEGVRFLYNILSIGGNIYCRTTKIFFGDRAIFVRRGILNKISGYRDIPVMSDVDFSKRMKRAGRVLLLTGPVISNERKFENESFFKIIYLLLWSLVAFSLGLDPAIIKKRYYGS
ncbi:MAG: glycosyltransferase [Candidatus Humimicrobiaceae bacterium]